MVLGLDRVEVGARRASAAAGPGTSARRRVWAAAWVWVGWRRSRKASAVITSEVPNTDGAIVANQRPGQRHVLEDGDPRQHRRGDGRCDDDGDQQHGRPEARAIPCHGHDPAPGGDADEAAGGRLEQPRRPRPRGCAPCRRRPSPARWRRTSPGCATWRRASRQPRGRPWGLQARLLGASDCSSGGVRDVRFARPSRSAGAGPRATSRKILQAGFRRGDAPLASCFHSAIFPGACVGWTTLESVGPKWPISSSTTPPADGSAAPGWAPACWCRSRP